MNRTQAFAMALRAALACGIAAGVSGPSVVLGATLTVTTLADDGPSSLRDRIMQANASVGVHDTIRFGVDGIITLRTRLPDIDDDLTIDGSGRSIVLSGGAAVQVLFVRAGKALTLDALSIIDGFCASPCSGGAILNAGTLKASHIRFANNAALLGGAIHNFGRLEVDRCSFVNNRARIGGAIHNFDALQVTRSTFKGNSASMGGGAIHNFDTLAVVESRFSENTTSGGGSDIQNLGTLSVVNSAFLDRDVDGNASGVFNVGARATMSIDRNVN